MQGCNPSADSMAGIAGVKLPLSSPAILAERVKSQGFGDRVPVLLG